jgi:hypothetical protein
MIEIIFTTFTPRHFLANSNGVQWNFIIRPNGCMGDGELNLALGKYLCRML